MFLDVTTPYSVVDLNTAVDNMDGDTELLQEIVGIFLDTADEQIRALRENIAAQEVGTVAIDAHGIKGAASNFCAGSFVQAALELELLAKGGSLDGADGLLDGMVERLEELKEVLAAVNWDELAGGR